MSVLIHGPLVGCGSVVVEVLARHVERLVVAAAVIVVVGGAGARHLQVQSLLLRHRHRVRGGRDTVAVVFFTYNRRVLID